MAGKLFKFEVKKNFFSMKILHHILHYFTIKTQISKLISVLQSWILNSLILGHPVYKGHLGSTFRISTMYNYILISEHDCLQKFMRESQYLKQVKVNLKIEFLLKVELCSNICISFYISIYKYSAQFKNEKKRKILQRLICMLFNNVNMHEF